MVSIFAMVLEKQTFFFKNMVVYRMEGDLGIFLTPPSRTIALTMDFFGGLFPGSTHNNCNHGDKTLGSNGNKTTIIYKK